MLLCSLLYLLDTLESEASFVSTLLYVYNYVHLYNPFNSIYYYMRFFWELVYAFSMSTTICVRVQPPTIDTHAHDDIQNCKTVFGHVPPRGCIHSLFLFTIHSPQHHLDVRASHPCSSSCPLPTAPPARIIAARFGFSERRKRLKGVLFSLDLLCFSFFCGYLCFSYDKPNNKFSSGCAVCRCTNKEEWWLETFVIYWLEYDIYITIICMTYHYALIYPSLINYIWTDTINLIYLS